MFKIYAGLLLAMATGYVVCEIYHQEENLKKRREKMELETARKAQEEQWSREHHGDFVS